MLKTSISAISLPRLSAITFHNLSPLSPQKGSFPLQRPQLTSGGRSPFSQMAGLNIEIPTKKLSDGTSIPVLGYGLGTAWFKGSGGGNLDQAIVDGAKTAIKVGYHHLDGAEAYGNEEEQGKAIKDSGVPRNKLFVTTKVLKNIKDIPNALDTSLKKLGLDYVDLYLIHSPTAVSNYDELQKAWADMEKVKKAGKAKSIGVSNFIKEDLDAVLKTATDPPTVNQLEFHPYLQRGDLIPYNKEKGILVTAYGPLSPVTKAAGGPLDGYLDALATKYYVSPNEILLRWCIDQDVVPITTSHKEQRLSDYLRSMAFKLTPKEIEEINSIGGQHHYRGFFKQRFGDDDRR